MDVESSSLSEVPYPMGVIAEKVCVLPKTIASRVDLDFYMLLMLVCEFVLPVSLAVLCMQHSFLYSMVSSWTRFVGQE